MSTPVSTTRALRARAPKKVLVGAAVLAAAVGLVATATPVATAQDDVPALQLVTLAGPGTAGGDATRVQLLAQQNGVLASIGSPEPVYRWTAALNGFAAHLSNEQVATLESSAEVVSIEANEVRPMASHSSQQRTAPSIPVGNRSGGQGIVIGFVDSGIAPDQPAFSALPGLGPDPARWRGTCRPGPGWPTTGCSRKVVGSDWFVTGFGADRVRASEHLSGVDAVGHGTQVASVAAGNSAVSVRVSGRSIDSFHGIAPQARIAAYKACWGAPDPNDDGCATADLVSAIDRATQDRVDVLNLAVAGPNSVDTVERALLGAAEADIVVIGAAGNESRESFAGHVTPWVTTVGASVGAVARGRVQALGGPSLIGAGRIQGPTQALGVVMGRDAAAPDATPLEARQCHPGSLDVRRVDGRAVVCERGGVGRVDKSLAVARADGVATILVNTSPAPVNADLHSLPTVHLTRADGRRLTRWLRRHPHGRVRLSSVRPAHTARVAGWSAYGDARSSLVKPDIVAPGQGVLAATPATHGSAWSVFSGTSAATARASGLAALLRAQHSWSAPVIRSVLTTTAAPVRNGAVLAQGAGQVGSTPPRHGLGFEIAAQDFRRGLNRLSWRELNMPSVMVRGSGTVTRTVTNLGTRAEYFSARATGFGANRVRVTPVALRLAPGERATVRITVSGAPTGGRYDGGWLVWRGARGSRTSVPVAISR